MDRQMQVQVFQSLYKFEVSLSVFLLVHCIRLDTSRLLVVLITRKHSSLVSLSSSILLVGCIL